MAHTESDFSVCAEGSTRRAARAKIAQLSNFGIASEELLRATPANYPLRFCGAALRYSPQLRPPSADAGNADEGSHGDDFHPWSQPVTWIAEFWSHSWHDAVLLKVVVLLVENNWSAASVVGTLAAFVSAALFAGGVLPSMTTDRKAFGREEPVIDAWSLPIGVLFFVLTLLCWRPGQTVFLDKLCISQTNEKKKLEGVLGIGAFLKSSRRLLVLLDSTYVTRLWCVFELSAYSKLMEKHPNKTLHFIPLPSGLTFIVGFVSVAVELIVDSVLSLPNRFLRAILLMSFIAVHFHFLRSYQRSLARLRCQFEEFSMNGSKCYCCTVGHVDADTGARLSCDRDVVNACVDSWFGSAEAFNAFVQHSLFHRFAKQVSPTRILFELHAFVSLPFIWHAMGVISVQLRQSELEHASREFVDIAAMVVIVAPAWCALLCTVSYLVRRRLTSRIADMSVSLVVGVGCGGPVVALRLLEMRVIHELGLEAVLVLSCIMLIPMCLVCCGLFRFRLSAAHSLGSFFSMELSIRAGATADIARDPKVSVFGNGIDQPDEAEWQDFTLDI